MGKRRGWRAIDRGRRAPTPRFWPKPRRSLFAAVRPFLLLILLLALWPLSDPRLLPPIGPIAGEPETVDRRFTSCGPGRGFACVVDGDTFRLGSRKIRIADINAPELAEPRCAAERQVAEQAKRHLLELLDDGPFTMVANRFDQVDRFGRELRHLERPRPGGAAQSIGDAMIEAGMAHPYLGALEPGWC